MLTNQDDETVAQYDLLTYVAKEQEQEQSGR